MHCCINVRQAENNILASLWNLGRNEYLSFEPLSSICDLLKTNRREIQGGQAKLREIIFPQKYVWITYINIKAQHSWASFNYIP
jgi:hypothetical protein